MQAILDQWQRLILPPADQPLNAGEQHDDRDVYTDVPPGAVILKKHLAGMATYAIAPVWRDPDGNALLTKVGVLEVDEGEEASPAKARALFEAATAAGLSAAVEWSGGGGCHVWIFAEPVPVTVMVSTLRRLKDAVPHTGGLVPDDRARVKLAPGWHRATGGWAYFYKADETPTPAVCEVVPKELMSYQLDVLAAIEPTPAPVLLAYAGMATRRAPAPLAVGAVPAGVKNVQPIPAAVKAAEPVPAAGRLALTISPDGHRLRLTVSGDGGAAVAADLSADEALALAADLIEGARRRLARTRPGSRSELA